MFDKLRKLASDTRNRALSFTGAADKAKSALARSGAVVVLTLHRVLDDEEFAATSSLGGIIVRERTFAALVENLARDCEFVDLSRGTPSWQPGGKPKVAITFDDGWLDNYYCAIPIATRHGAPLTVFVCPGLIDEPFPFWPERLVHLIHRHPAHPLVTEVARSAGLVNVRPSDDEILVEYVKHAPSAERTRFLSALGSAPEVAEEPSNRTMTWTQLIEIRRRGVEIGSHTHSHQILTQVDPAVLPSELARPRREISNTLRSDCHSLAYPNGDFSETVVKAAAEAGYRYAFTTQFGIWTPATDPLRIPRLNLSENHLTDSSGRFSTHSYAYNVFGRAVKYLNSATSPQTVPGAEQVAQA